MLCWSPRASGSALFQIYDFVFLKSLRPCWDLGEAGVAGPEAGPAEMVLSEVPGRKDFSMQPGPV